MYSLPHWIDLIRVFGYHTLPMEAARTAIAPIAEKHGKEAVAAGCEALVEVTTTEQKTTARLKLHIRQMAFQILGPEPPPGAPTPTPPAPETGPTPQGQVKELRPAKKRMSRRPAGRPVTTAPASPEPNGRSPVMEQYRLAKERHPGMMLLFRMGDFYELFDQDAEVAHKLLGLTLTTRDRSITMAGFPHHQLEAYLHKLLKEGKRGRYANRSKNRVPEDLSAGM